MIKILKILNNWKTKQLENELQGLKDGMLKANIECEIQLRKNKYKEE